jgi:hypothetical protein
MKKNIFYIIGFAASLLIAVPACTDLDEEVYDKIPAETFGSTETEINALVGTAYKTLKNYFSDGNFMALDDMAGSCTVTPTRYGGDWYDGGQYREIYMHTYTSSTSCVKGAWSNASSAIGTCNANLLVVQNSTILDDSDKAQKEAEIRGVRAFWFYKMMDEWGAIPLVTDYTDKTLPSRTSRQEVFDWLLQELNDIVDDLPDFSDENYGKFTKGADYTLQAILYLNADAWNVSVDNAYENVVSCCNKVMEMGYSLESDFANNFTYDDYRSSEAILAVPFSKTDTGYDNRNQLMNRTLHYKDIYALGISASTWNGVCTQPEYVRLFDTTDTRYTQTFLIGQMYDITTGEALVTDHGRLLNHTIDITMISGTEYDGTTWGAVNQEDGARCQKWPFESDLVDAMGNDFLLFRYAEVLLMKAEALVRLGTDNATATDLVNQVRERAFGDTDHDYTSVDLDDIQLERRLEFAWELKSRQDDIRFGCYEEGMWPESGCDRSTDTFYRLFPVSQDAIDINANLDQNEGY